MKKVSLFILYILFLKQAVSQSIDAKGKVVYESTVTGKIRFVEMYFSGLEYMYYESSNPMTAFTEKKEFASVQDSLNYIKNKERINDFFEQMPPSVQFWYGRSGDSIVVNTFELDGNVLKVADTLRFVTWTLEADTARIEGVYCQKAKGVTPSGQRITAWFAPAIPVSVAPYTLRGLPGLLMYAMYDNGKVQLKVSQLDWPVKQKKQFQFPDRIGLISRMESEKIVQEHNVKALKLLEYYKKERKDGN